MTLVIAIKSSEGIVLAAESRDVFGNFAYFDNATKLFSFKKPHNYIGVLTYGVGAIGSDEEPLKRTIESYMPDFESTLHTPKRRISVSEFAQRISKFFMEQWDAKMPQTYQGAPLGFIVGGFDDEKSVDGNLYQIQIPYDKDSDPIEINKDDWGSIWRGETGIADKIMFGYDAHIVGDTFSKVLDYIIPKLPLDDGGKNNIRQNLSTQLQGSTIYERIVSDTFSRILAYMVPKLQLDDKEKSKIIQDLSNQLQGSTILQDLNRQFAMPFSYELPLQDCINLAVFLIRTTIKFQEVSSTIPRTCGGPIDVAVITRTDGLQYVQRKQLVGEVD